MPPPPLSFHFSSCHFEAKREISPFPIGPNPHSHPSPSFRSEARNLAVTVKAKPIPSPPLSFQAKREISPFPIGPSPFPQPPLSFRSEARNLAFPTSNSISTTEIKQHPNINFAKPSPICLSFANRYKSCTRPQSRLHFRVPTNRTQNAVKKILSGKGKESG